jgi:hypothetical protein
MTREQRVPKGSLGAFAPLLHAVNENEENTSHYDKQGDPFVRSHL